jgi:ANTAR domain
MSPTVEHPPTSVPTVLPGNVVCTPTGQPAVLLVRTGHGWTVLGADPVGGWVEVSPPVAAEAPALTLVEAMSLADLVAAELGVTPEPDRQARRAARTGSADDGEPDGDPRDEEITALRRTIGQLEHALAARVSIERAIGVLAERHGITPRAAFEDLRRRARSQGRPAQELATEVLEGLDGSAAAPSPLLPAAGPHPAAHGSTARRVQRPRRASGDDIVHGTPC